MTTYHVENFGCRATQADGAELERQFAGRGLDRATMFDADVVVLNTCTVTAAADQDARAAIRRTQRQNPKAKIVVTGCYAQRAPQEIAALPGVCCVVGNSHKHQLTELVFQKEHPNRDNFIPLARLGSGERASSPELYVSDIFAHTELLAAPVFESSVAAHDRTRPNLKVQDGCDNRCSFCVIPSVRGQSRSLPQERVIDAVNGLVAEGYRELVISGINLGRWGRDFKRASSFVSLLRAILEQTALEKLRISSVEPMDWSDDLIDLVASSPRIAKHAHVPLQSGSDAVLRRMHRKYRPWHYREKIEEIRAAVPDAAIGADVMVGFPSETDAEFECTRRLIEELPFTYLHVFTYSSRPGTPAAEMRNQIPVHLARERNKILRELAAQKKDLFMRAFVGQALEAITLNVSHDKAGESSTETLTDNYQKLMLRGRHAANRWITAKVERVEDGAFVGTVKQAAS